jgi:hypothetical protein
MVTRANGRHPYPSSLRPVYPGGPDLWEQFMIATPVLGIITQPQRAHFRRQRGFNTWVK